MDSDNPNIDAIDLTLSSPEPEQKPQVPPRQSRASIGFKKESNKSGFSNTEVYRRREGKSSTQHDVLNDARSVNPQHLRQIIDTSNSHALRKVVLNLCSMSPALSGAIARGLAPHSTFARGVVSRQRTMSRRPTTTPAHEDDSDAAYAQTIRKLSPRIASPHVGISRKVEEGEDYSSHHLARTGLSLQTGHRRRIEPKRSSGSSETADDGIRLPGSYPSAGRTPHRNSARQSTAISSTFQPRSLSRGSASAIWGTKCKTCTQCLKPFEDEFDVCMYHPGNAVKNEDGAAIYSCCNKQINKPGCQFSCHTTDSELAKESISRKRPSVSPTPSGARTKMSRLV